MTEKWYIASIVDNRRFFLATLSMYNMNAMKNLIPLFFLILLGTGSLWSQTVTFTGATDNSWHKDCNWDTNTMPTCTDNAVIPTGLVVDVTGTGHCRNLELQGTADINIIGTATLEVSDANTCAGSVTASTGCSIPGAWFNPCDMNPPVGPSGFCTFDYFVCPSSSSKCHIWYNNTGSTISVNLPSASPNMTWSPGQNFTIPPNSQLNVCVISGGTPCVGFVAFSAANWSSSPDIGFGIINITH